MVSLVRVGVLVLVLGASLAILWTVAFGAVAASTEVHCPDAPRDYSVPSVDPATATVWVDDGCNRHRVARPVAVGLAVSVAGAAVEGAGLVARSRRDGGG